MTYKETIPNVSIADLYKKQTQVLRQILDWYDIHPDFDKPISSQHISDDTTCVEELKKAAFDLAHIALADDYNIYVGFQYFKFIENTEPIEERIKQGIRGKRSSRINFDLYKEAVRLANNEGYVLQLAQTVLDENPEIFPLVAEITPPINSKIQTVIKTIDRYTDRYQIPRLPIDDRLAVDFINAAGEIAGMDYDCIIGVLNAGAPIPIILEILGKKTGYIEWHRNSKKIPKWRKTTIDIDIIGNPQKILVCENDVSTGATLKKIIPYLEELRPSQVDVCFHSPVWFPMQQVMSTIPFYTNYFHIKTLNKKQFINYLDQMNKCCKIWNSVIDQTVL